MNINEEVEFRCPGTGMIARESRQNLKELQQNGTLEAPEKSGFLQGIAKLLGHTVCLGQGGGGVLKREKVSTVSLAGRKEGAG